MTRKNNKINESTRLIMQKEILSFVPEGVKKSNMPKRMSKWFIKASELAFKSNFHTAKIGCVLVYKNHILGEGYNQLKTHPKQKIYNQKYRKWTNDPDFSKTCGHTIHAEIDALTSVPYPIGIKVDWKKVDVFVYRVGPGLDNYSGLALPCPACANSLLDIGIHNVYYTTGNSDKPFGHCDL